MSQTPDIPRDFDFLFGHWHVQNHKLTTRLQGGTEWVTFDATQICSPALNGIGNTDEMIGLDGTPIGMSLRFFNREIKKWFIYWVGYGDGVMQPPVAGTFTDGIGTFEGADTWQGKPILVRFVWSNTTTGIPRWEQFFSPDDGQTWEKNWEMNFTPIAKE